MEPSSSFPGEPFLRVLLPNYDDERSSVTRILIANAIFWIVVFPLVLSEAGRERSSSTPSSSDLEPKKKHRAAREKKNASSSAPSDEKKEPETIISTTTPSVIGLLLMTVIILALKNPHNYFSIRRVFVAPLFTKDECQKVMNMASVAAEINYERAIIGNIEFDEDSSADAEYTMLQREPQGWRKDRHGSYPTTDLNWVTDPFTAEDRAWLSQRLDARLAPLLERTFGVPAKSIRANDMFVVRYDALKGDGHRKYLSNHTDSSDISFNVILNDDFEGGGTRFWDRLKQRPFAHVTPKLPGTVLAHPAVINHEGATITSGTRMILVGFLSIDRVDPFDTSVMTGLSWQASWGCWSWLTTKFKEAYGLRSGRTEDNDDEGEAHWTNDNKWVKGFLLDMVRLFQGLGDAFATHVVEELVSDKAANYFIQALDEAYYAKGDGTANKEGSVNSGAVWWAGQNIHIDITGAKAREWESRKQNADTFAEL